MGLAAKCLPARKRTNWRARSKFCDPRPERRSCRDLSSDQNSSAANLSFRSICRLRAARAIIWLGTLLWHSICPCRSFASGCCLVHARNDNLGSERSSPRSEEHTSELQSLMRISYAVFCLKKKKSLQHTLQYKTKKT